MAPADLGCPCDCQAWEGRCPRMPSLPSFTKAGGIWLLPHLARLAARTMTAGVPKGWRRGRMAPVPKKAMLPFNLQSGRGVLCANVAGKVVAKVVRSQLVGPLAAEAGARQHGAVPRGSTEFPSHTCGLHSKKAARTRRPAAALVADLAGAFYSALPELALGAILSSRKRDPVFDALGIAGEQRACLEEVIRSEDTTMKRQDVAVSWRKMAADFHRDPWFWVSGSRKQVHAFVGTLPGDPLADVVF